MIKINKDCHEIYGGLIPQSFILMFVNMLLSNIFQVFVTEMIFYPLVARIKRSTSIDAKSFNTDNNNTDNEQHLHNSRTTSGDSAGGVRMNVGDPGDLNPLNAPTASVGHMEAGTGTSIMNPEGGELAAPLISGTGEIDEKDLQKFRSVEAVDHTLLLVGYKSKLYFLRLSFIFAIMSIVAAFINISDKHSTWVQYQNFYGLILNSSVMTLIGAGEAISSEGELLLERQDLIKKQRLSIEAVDYEVALLTGVPILFVMPSLLTHIVPALFAYIYMIPVVLLGFGLPLYGLLYASNAVLVYAGNTCLKDTSWAVFLSKLHTQAMNNLVPKLVVVICAQIFYDYGTYLYDVNYPISGSEYAHVIVQEYDLRSQTFCLVEQRVASIKHLLVMFSWL